MGIDAVKELRQWQRREAGLQEQALRAAAKAHDRLRRLDEERVAAEAVLADALEALATTGIARDQAAAFLGVSASALPSGSRPPGRRRSAQLTPTTSDTEPRPRPKPSAG